MADPPVPAITSGQEGGGKVGDEKSQEDGLLLIKDGYFRYIDILFEWCKYMNPWQVSIRMI